MSGLLLCKMSRPFKVLIALLCMVVGLSMQAQTITIGTGTATTTQKFPLGSNWGFERSASLYTAAEIAGAGGSAGTILSVAWNATASVSVALPIKIYIKSVPAGTTTITAQNWATVTTGATLVYGGTIGTIPIGWYNLPLQLPYTYNGTDNLMVLVETNYGGSGGGTSTGAKFTYSTATSQHMTYQADSTAPTGNGSVGSNRPDIQMTFGTPPSCLGMPPGGTITTGTINATNAVINWTPYSPAPAGGYDVYYNTNNVPPTAVTLPSQTVPGPTATLTPLLPLTTYYVWVRARCSATDQSVWTGSKSFATPATCPAMPTSGTITTGTITPTTAVINWTAYGYTPAQGFDIYYSTTSAAPNAGSTPNQNVPTGTTTTIGPLLPNTTYYVWVRARCSATDQSTWTGPKSLATPPTCLPVPSAAGSVTVGTVTPNSAVVNWTASPSAPAGGYEVFYSTSSTPPTATSTGIVVPTGTTTTLQPLTTGVTYYWWVRAICTPTDRSSWVAGPVFVPGQIGTGSGKSSQLPVNSNWGYNYSQQLYTAAEVGAVLGTARLITSVKFYVDTPQTDQAKYNDWTVYLGNTTKTSFASTTDWVPLTGMSPVFSGTIPNMTAGTWVTIPTKPFVWNGTGNLVVAVDENSPDYTSTADWGSYNAGTNRGMVVRDDTNNPDPASPPTASSRYADIPRLMLTGVDLVNCTTAPPTGISVSNITPSSAIVTWIPTIGATYKLRYKAVSSATWNPVIDITTAMTGSWPLNNLSDQTQYEVQIMTVCQGTPGAYSTSVNFTTPPLTYCTNVPPNTTSDGYISKVVVTPTNAPLMVSSSGYDVYKDYSTDPTRVVTLMRGTTGNKINITKYWPGSTSSYGVGVWIDLNRNGVFEASERVVTSSSSTTAVVGTVTAGFEVKALPDPATYSGPLLTRMRVVMMDGTVSSPCGTWASYYHGEVEDYAVRLIDQPVCTTAPPTGITVSNITDVGATFSWIAAPGATYQLQYRKVGTGTWTQVPSTSIPAPGNVYSIPTTSPLTEQTQYEVQVSTKCSTTFGSYSTSVLFTTLPLQYCQVTGSGDNDHISNVTVISSNLGVPTMSNNTVQNYYTSYNTPATLITLDADSKNNKISVAKGWTGSSGNDAVAAWIDFNRNGQFEATERILGTPGSVTTPVTALFDVPTGAYVGPYTTTMRVVLKRTTGTAIPTACANAVDGEVEDYAVRIRPCTSGVPNAPTFSNITHISAQVNLTGAATITTYLVRYRVAGSGSAWTEVYASTILGNIPLIINGLTPATTYEVEVAAVCGATAGTATAIKTFTTRCDPTPPNVTISSITPTSALITWAPLAASSTYTMRWRKVGTTGWPNANIALPAAPANTYVLGSVIPLEPFTTYEVQIANKCNGEVNFNDYSNPKVFTTERTCQIPPPGLTITQLLPTSAEVKWDPFPGATYVLRYRKVGIPSWTDVPTPVNSVVLTGLVEMTKYEMQVVNICSGTPGNYTPPYYFTTPTVIYCKMASANATGEHISKVTVKPNGKPVMENASGASSYTDYTGVPKTFIELIQGSTDNEIIIEKKWTGNTYKEGIVVWIDFNRNGEFDIDEKVFTSNPNTDTPVSGKFSVPADAFVSTSDYKYVVMRVAMQRDGLPVSCTNFANGEVEDYTVRISKKGVSNIIDQTDILIYPNPVSSVLFVKNISKKAKYKIYNAAGQVIGDGILLNGQINVSRLINGVYVIDIDDNGKTVQKKFIKE